MERRIVQRANRVFHCFPVDVFQEYRYKGEAMVVENAEGQRLMTGCTSAILACDSPTIIARNGECLPVAIRSAQ